jgi:hypothetical protein
MDRITFLITLFCLIDDWLIDHRVRQRGPAPILHDSEVLTIEVAGAFFGIDTDEELVASFRRCYADLFPRLCRVDRTTFARQSANLWKIPALSVIDSCPLPVCRFARSRRCRRLRAYSAYGYDDVSQQIFYGMRLHLRLCWPGVIVAVALVPANEPDLPVATDSLLPDVAGWVLADRNYQSAVLPHPWIAPAVRPLIPPKHRTHETARWPRTLTQKRRRIETVFSQLVQRYRTKRLWARDLWHLASRWLRCVVSHTIAVLFCQRAGLSPLQFDRLLTD